MMTLILRVILCNVVVVIKEEFVILELKVDKIITGNYWNVTYGINHFSEETEAN